MVPAKRTIGYFIAFLLLILISCILFFSFKKYGLWTLLYIPEAGIFLMCLYVFLPGILLFIGYPKIKKFFISTLPPTDKEYFFFTILIPAHNEERLLPVLLTSLNNQTYSKEHYQVIVVADRCKDDTAHIARMHGAYCLERFTGQQSNKQGALRFGIENFSFPPAFQEGYICIIDADCEAHPDFLREMNYHLTKNPQDVAVQSYRYVKNIYESNITVLDGAAEALRNWVFAAPRKWLGIPVFINGSGVFFKKTLFEKLVSLPSRHLAEDKEWKAFLSERNIKVDYCGTAQIGYEAVVSQKDFEKQRSRWIGSHIEMLKKYAWKTLIQSIINLNLIQFDFFCSIVQLPRSLLFAFALLFTALDFLLPTGSFFPHWAWLIIITGLILYGVLGIYLAKARVKDYLALPYFLKLISGILRTTFLAFFGKGISQWRATRIDDE